MVKEKYLLGMPTLIEFESIDENMQLCKELNLDFIEINMNLPQFQLCELGKIDIDDRIMFSLHLPEETNIWDFNDIIKNAYIESIIETINIAKSKGINILNLHMNLGVYFTLPNKKVYLFEKHEDLYIKNTMQFAKIIDEELKNTGIKIYIENTGIYNNAFIIRALSELLKFDCFALTWDIGHDFSSNHNDLPFLRSMNSKIQHMHFHDAIGSTNHLALGQGNIDIKNIFSITGKSCNSIVFETKNSIGLIDSIKFYRDAIGNGLFL